MSIQFKYSCISKKGFILIFHISKHENLTCGTEKMPCCIVEIMFMHGKIGEGFHTFELLREGSKREMEMA